MSIHLVLTTITCCWMRRISGRSKSSFQLSSLYFSYDSSHTNIYMRIAHEAKNENDFYVTLELEKLIALQREAVAQCTSLTFITIKVRCTMAGRVIRAKLLKQVDGMLSVSHA